MKGISFIRQDGSVNAPALVTAFVLIVSGIGVLGHYMGTYLPVNPDHQVAETAKSIWETGSLERKEFREIYDLQLEKSRQNPGESYWQDIFALGRNDKLYPLRGVLLSYLGAPFYGLFGGFGFWVLNQLLMFAVLFALFRIARTLISAKMALLMCSLIAVGTEILKFSFTFSYDLFAAALLVVGLDLLRTSPFAGAMLATLSIETRPTNLLYLPFVLLAWYPYYAHKRNALLKVLASFALGALAVGLLNWKLWGSPLTSGYQRLIFFESGQAVFPKFFAVSLDVLLSGWGEKLFGAANGLIRYNPIIVLFPFGLFVALKGKYRYFYLLVAGGVLLHVVFMYSLRTWSLTGNANRYLLTSIILMTLVSAKGLDKFISQSGQVPPGKLPGAPKLTEP